MADSWQSGFVRDDDGRLVVTLALDPETESWLSGFVRDDEGRLVVSGVGGPLSTTNNSMGVVIYDAEKEEWPKRPDYASVTFIGPEAIEDSSEQGENDIRVKV